MSIRVQKPGLSTTVQDYGRFGFAHLGISPCGAADAVSLRIANRLVGNDQYAPALEMTLLGATLQFLSDAEIALSGADCGCTLGKDGVAMYSPLKVTANSVLQCGSTLNGVRTYLAIAGGINVPLIMGSASTDVRGKFGGIEGRRLKAGDVLEVGNDAHGPFRSIPSRILDELSRTGPIRVTRGAQANWFSKEQFNQFLASSYTISEQSDRAGLRLNGESINPIGPGQLLTDGIPLGAIQVPPDGQPILLFVDQQTTGGYPKIANAIAADIHRIGQLRPRDEIRFAEVSVSEAIDALRAQERWLKDAWQE